ncbi:nucleotidyltransferase family protein [Phenylobacterium sp.]|uniref:nucleotidyltransferase family protein n=1 Tax=Phenylobacterium sp. TaxID=1871053 RepID=UPI0037CACA0F
MSAPVDIRPQDLHAVWGVLSAALPKDAQVFVFGSRAKGNAKRASDLDLAVDLGRALSRAERILLAEGFEASDLPYRVDVVDLWDVSESFAAIIEGDKVALAKVEVSG